MPHLPSVLIATPRADEREVLSTALARRGLRIWEATEPEQGLQLAREHHPDVIVLDAEMHFPGYRDVADRFAEACNGERASLILLGRVSREPLPRAGETIAKPYHFGPLIHRIEQLAAKAA
jgi:CheY-like chemotaxis protein